MNSDRTLIISKLGKRKEGQKNTNYQGSYFTTGPNVIMFSLESKISLIISGIINYTKVDRLLHSHRIIIL